MQVILLQRVEKLGQMGDVVTVKQGFARNFLLPTQKALRATKDNIALFESKRIQLEANNLQRKEEAEQIGQKMHGARVVLIRQASETGLLYGSIRAIDIANALTESGYTVGREQIHIETPIKNIGIHAPLVVLHSDVKIPVQVVVAQSEEQAQAQVQAQKSSAKSKEEVSEDSSNETEDLALRA